MPGHKTHGSCVPGHKTPGSCVPGHKAPGSSERIYVWGFRACGGCGPWKLIFVVLGAWLPQLIDVGDGDDDDDNRGNDGAWLLSTTAAATMKTNDD